jgi:hypothetical protein
MIPYNDSQMAELIAVDDAAQVELKAAEIAMDDANACRINFGDSEENLTQWHASSHRLHDARRLARTAASRAAGPRATMLARNLIEAKAPAKMATVKALTDALGNHGRLKSLDFVPFPGPRGLKGEGEYTVQVITAIFHFGVTFTADGSKEPAEVAANIMTTLAQREAAETKRHHALAVAERAHRADRLAAEASYEDDNDFYGIVPQ